MKKLFSFLIVCLIGFSAWSQTKQAPEVPSPIIFIYDASGSMWGQMEGKTKMEIAANVLASSINNFSENQQIGLVAYGHRKKGDCRDVETLLPMSNTSKTKVSNSLKAIKPLGKTPLAYAANIVIEKLRKNQKKATIVLITDGIESCDGNICEVVAAAKKEGIDFKLHIVGFGLKAGETEQLKCAAKMGDGNYYDAVDTSGLGQAMSDVANQTVDKPIGNHGIYATMNGAPIDVLVSAFKAGTKKRVDGIRTYRDTAYIYLPQENYDLEVRPLENSEVTPISLNGIKTFNDKITYSMVSFDGGIIAISGSNNGQGWDCTVKIEDVLGKNVATGRTYGKVKEFELNQGTYSITLQALKINGLETEMIIENKTVIADQTIQVTHNFETGTLEILPTLNDKLIDCTVNIIETTSGKNIASGRSYDKGIKKSLNPGTYEVKVNALKKSGAIGKKSVTVTIKAGESKQQVFKY